MPEKTLKIFLSIFLFLLPWQTIWIIQEQFLNGEKWQYGTIGFYATELLLWVSILLFIVWFWKKFKFQIDDFKFQISKDRVFVFVCLLFIAYSSLSFFWAINKEVAFQHSFHILEAFLLFFILYLGPLKFTIATKAFVYGSVLPSILGIWQFLTQSTFASKFLGLTNHPVWESGTSIISGSEIGRWLRAYGSFSHPNVFGGFLVIAIIFTLILLHHQKTKPYILHSIFCIQSAALFFTFSRSAWIAFGIVSLVYGLSACRQTRRTTVKFFVPCFLFLAFLTIIFFPLVQTRFSGEGYNEIRSISERVSGYSEAFTIFKRHHLLGVGAGNYTAAAFALDPNLPGFIYQPVHNVPLLVLVELGLLGMFLIFFIIGSFISYQLSVNSKLKIKNFVIFHCLLLTVYCSLFLFDHYLFSSYVGLMLGGVYFGLTLDKKTDVWYSIRS